MKLQSFENDSDFKRALESVGAVYAKWEPGPTPLPKDLSKKLESGLVEVENPREVETDDIGLLTFKDHKVVVYIRDQYPSRDQGGYYSADGRSHYKYHLTKCTTLKTMQRGGRYKKRYVYTTRRDGSFIINRISYDTVMDNDILVEMGLCSYCWNNLQSVGISERLGVTHSKFKLADYFKIYKTQITELPVHSPSTAPLNTYSEDQSKISKMLKKKYNYHCQKCHVNFSQEEKWLHMHHKDGQKSNNDSTNLTVFCLACHAEQPQHQHLKASKEYQDALAFRTQALGR